VITCTELAELLLDFHSGALEAEHHNHVEQHLVDCADCQAYFESYHITVRLARQLPAPPLPAEFEQRLQEMLGEQGEPGA
jgi:anti-sigma factor RsiW